MFSATAIIRCPRTSRNSLVDWATDTAATATSTTDDHQQLEDQELAGQAACDQAMFSMTTYFLCVLNSDVGHFGVQYC